MQLSLSGHYKQADLDVPAGSVFMDLRQPLVRLVPVLLEPNSPDRLAVWGFFNRAIVRQWSSAPAPYPVLRLDAPPPVPLVLDATE